MVYYDIFSGLYIRTTNKDIWDTWLKLVKKYSDEYARYLAGEVEIEPFVTYAEWLGETSGFSGRNVHYHLSWRYSEFVKLITSLRPYYNGEKGEYVAILEYNILPKSIV